MTTTQIVTPADILRKAKSLIEDPQTWIKRDSFAEIDGKQCYCSVGALTAASDELTKGWWDSAEKAYKALLRQTDDVFLARWNDSESTTHAVVMAAFDRAIEAVA